MLPLLWLPQQLRRLLVPSPRLLPPLLLLWLRRGLRLRLPLLLLLRLCLPLRRLRRFWAGALGPAKAIHDLIYQQACRHERIGREVALHSPAGVQADDIRQQMGTAVTSVQSELSTDSAFEPVLVLQRSSAFCKKQQAPGETCSPALGPYGQQAMLSGASICKALHARHDLLQLRRHCFQLPCQTVGWCSLQGCT